MKKGCSILLALSILLVWIPQMGKAASSPDWNLLWMEAETSVKEIPQGVSLETNSLSSGGQALCIVEKMPEETVLTFSYSFMPPEAGMYDIYFLGSPADANWLSPVKYRFDGVDRGYLKDGENYKQYGHSYNSGGGIGNFWQRVDSLYLSNRNYDMDFIYDKARTFVNNGCYVAAMDVIAIVPSNAEIDLSSMDADEGKAEILAKSLTLGINPKNLHSNVTLPDLTAYGAEVTWESDDETVITSAGVINADSDVAKHTVLTAAVSVGDAVAKKRIPVTVTPEKQTETTINALLLQAADAENKGGFSLRVLENSLAEQVYYCNQTDEGAYGIEYSFEIENDGTYDIWVLAASGNHKWSSPYAWSLDGGVYQNHTAAVDEVYKSPDNSQSIGWSKLGTQNLSAEAHRLSLQLTDYREANMWDCYYQIFDTVFLVPEEMEIIPSGYVTITDEYVIADAEQITYSDGYELQDGKMMTAQATAAGAAADFSLSVVKESIYDIFLLASENFIYAIDDTIYKNPVDRRRIAYSDGTDYYWYHLDERALQAGMHTVSIQATGANNVCRVVISDQGMNYDPYTIDSPMRTEYQRYVRVDYRHAVSETGVSCGFFDGSMAAQCYYVYGETEDAEITYSFTVPYTEEYDVWVLSNGTTAKHLSPITYSLDGGASVTHTKKPEREVWSWKGLSVGWTKLGTDIIPAGNANLEISFDNRLLAEDKVGCIDTVLLVPAEWVWSPVDNALPYDTTELSFDITGGEISTDVKRGADVGITMQTILHGESTADVVYAVDVMYEGERFASVYQRPEVRLNHRTIEKTYTESLSFYFPEYAPEGEYRILARIVGAEEGTGIAAFRYGETLPEKLTAQISAFSLSENMVQAEILNASVTGRGVRMEFRKDGVLWGVEELAPITAAGHYQAAFRLPQLPAGEYQVTLGIEGMEVSCPECVVTVTKQSDIKPLSNGAYYSKKSGETHFWYVNQNGAMIWDGEPFIPMGGMFCPDFVTEYDPEDVALNLANWQEAVDVLDQLEEHGIYDLYINANSDTVGDRAAWQYLVDYLDERGFRYGIQINTSNADYNGYYVTANVNAITATVAADTTTATKSVTHKYLGRADVVSGAYFVTVGSEVIARGIAQVTKTDTHFSFSASGLPVTGSAKKIYFLPYAEGATTTAPNFYEYREENEEKLQNFFEQMKFGDGMRFVVDPTYNETTYANWTEGFRPYYMEYNKGLSDWLEEKYQTMDALNRAWCVSPKIESFWEAAHLIPVSTIEEKTWLYNVENYQIYEYDNVSGCMWDDNIFYREKGLRDFHMDVADLIKESCQIPVIYKNVAYYNAFFVNDRGDSGHDGIGNEAYGDFSRIARLQGAVNGMCNESAKTMWNVVTETNIEENMTLKTESGIISYPDKQTMYEHFNTLISAGSKGIYDFLFNNSNSWAKAYCYTEKPELFDWMSEYSSYINAEELAEQGVQAPQFYSYPATPAWWNQEGSGWHNKWTAVLYRKDITMPIHRVLDNGAILAGVDSLDNVSENIVVSIQNAPASLVYGKELQENYDRLIQNHQVIVMGLREDVGSIPCIDRYFTNKTQTLTKSDAYHNASGDKVQILNPPEGAEILFTTNDGSPWAFRYGNLWIFANKNWTNNNVRYLSDFCFSEEQVGLNKVYYYQDGDCFIAPRNGTCRAVFKVDNYSGKEINATLIVAINQNEEMITKKIVIPKGAKNQKVQLDLNVQTESVEKVQYYLWDGVGTLKPLIPKQ